MNIREQSCLISTKSIAWIFCVFFILLYFTFSFSISFFFRKPKHNPCRIFQIPVDWSVWASSGSPVPHHITKSYSGRGQSPANLIEDEWNLNLIRSNTLAAVSHNECKDQQHLLRSTSLTEGVLTIQTERSAHWRPYYHQIFEGCHTDSLQSIQW